ncbi:hypothetical protein V5O48_006990 [Marasmius crinis-equi]|uniref:Uncharacterized protein n=1 Tax=Marasmius crinis-equi TaxID=585013 RepID=A0ABR3FI01_9AGAR
MPRPKIYKNASQKKAALRIKSQRYYWNHRERVLTRVKKYQESQRGLPEKRSEEVETDVLKKGIHIRGECSFSNSDPLLEARRLHAAVLDETQRHPLQFLQRIYEDLRQRSGLVHHSDDHGGEASESLLAQAAARFARFNDSISPTLNQILQQHGARAEFEEAERISTQIRAILGCLQDMECAELVNEVKEVYDRGEYLFQQAETRRMLSSL